MLELDKVTVRQGDFILRADLAVKRGQRAAILGPSGAGKSTLLGAIAGFIPHGGSIRVNGCDVTHARPDARGIAMLFQDGNLFPHLTLLQNIGLGLCGRLRLNAEHKARARQALAQVELQGFENRHPAELSGGQQSRAALARILIQGQALLLLDEPFAALDAALRVQMLDLLDRLVKDSGATLLFVTHAVQDAERIADQIIRVEDGHATGLWPVKNAHEPEAP